MFSTDDSFQYKQEEEEAAETPDPSRQKLKIYIDRKQRAGKEVTIVEGYVGAVAELEALAKQLKTKCGTGGSVKDGLIIVQGDFRQKIKTELDRLKYNSRII